MEEFEFMGVSFAFLMAVLFIAGVFADNDFVMALSLMCAVGSGILLNGYESKEGVSYA